VAPAVPLGTGAGETSEKLSAWIKLVYGAPTVAGAAIAIPILVHMPKFYSDVVLVPVGYIALAIALARGLDAITDPVMGWLSDNTRTRWGRRRPWIASGVPFCAVALIAMFNPPESLTPEAAGVWFAATFALYFLFHTVYEIPYQGLGAELTLDHHERTLLFGWRALFVVAGTILAAALPGLLQSGDSAGEQRQLLGWMAVGFAAALLVLFGLLVACIGERAEFAQRKSNPLIPGVRRALRNRPFAILMIAFVVGSLTGAMPPMLLPFFTDYVLQPESTGRAVAFFLVLYFGSGFLFVPAWTWLGRRVGKRNAWLVSMLIGVSAGPLLFTAGKGDITWVALLHVWAGLAFGAGILLVPSMQADVIDYDELRTGKRREAQYAAFWAIVPKFVAIPGAALPIAALAQLGYVPNAEQPPQVLMGIRTLYALVPALFGAITVAIVWRYPISEAAHIGIREGIARHARGESATDPLTGQLLPPPLGGVDEDLGWFLDFFSRRELERAARGPGGVFAIVLVKLAVYALLTCIAVGLAITSVQDLDVQPGLLAVTAVVTGGFALTGTLFHALRLAAARRLEADPIDPALITRHLAAS
jgi:GPH family glycoside/pentoside/hexuronide:cation symporter